MRKAVIYVGLEEVFSIQREFTEKWLRISHGLSIDRLSAADRERIAKDLCLSLIDEVMEFLRHLNWKSHRYYKHKDVDRDKLLVESIDLWKFWINLCLVFDFTPREVIAAFNAKTAVVAKRFRHELMTIISGHPADGIAVKASGRAPRCLAARGSPPRRRDHTRRDR